MTMCKNDDCIKSGECRRHEEVPIDEQLYEDYDLKDGECQFFWPLTRKIIEDHDRKNTTNNSGKPEYAIWKSAKQRCTNKKNQSYKRYGGRGIQMCGRWVNSFINFYKDMGKRPSRKYSLERMNNDGNYEPSNCKWATSTEQNNNKSNNRKRNCQTVS